MARRDWFDEGLRLLVVTRALATLSAVAALLAVAPPALAFSPVLTATQTQAAIAQGRSAAAAHLGYELSGYLVYSVGDALVIVPGQGSVDAVVVGTPFERVAFASYVAAFQGSGPSSDAIANAAESNTIDFIVFAHSADAKDQAFLRHFKSAELAAADKLLQPSGTSFFGPAEDFYSTPHGARVPRWLGYESFRFDLRSLAATGVDIAHLKGTFSIIDPYSRRYAFPFDLSKYR
jgi:hypothetical protein